MDALQQKARGKERGNRRGKAFLPSTVLKRTLLHPRQEAGKKKKTITKRSTEKGARSHELCLTSEKKRTKLLQVGEGNGRLHLKWLARATGGGLQRSLGDITKKSNYARQSTERESEIEKED